jgi:hypothetical protein
MIMYSFGRYLTQTVHDHEPCPKCLNLKFGHCGYNGSISGQDGSRGGEHHGPFGITGFETGQAGRARYGAGLVGTFAAGRRRAGLMSGASRMPNMSRSAVSAASSPQRPCTPGTGGVAEEHR